MTQWRWFTRSLIAVLLCLSTSAFARASEYFGHVTFGGLPVPGATITATQGTKTIRVTSDEGGVFRFDDLPDGQWKIEVKMLCFETIDADVTIASKMSATKYELKLLPADELRALATAPPPQLTAPKPALQAGVEKKPEAGGATQTPPEMPKPPEDANQQSSDGFLVNGSVNNAATSQFSLNQAFGNRRFNTKSLYNSDFGLILDNSSAPTHGHIRSPDLRLEAKLRSHHSWPDAGRAAKKYRTCFPAVQTSLSAAVDAQQHRPNQSRAGSHVGGEGWNY